MNSKTFRKSLYNIKGECLKLGKQVLLVLLLHQAGNLRVLRLCVPSAWCSSWALKDPR